ncbi:hypothetical protein [Halomontanus rarus]|uniref:hypothetical protein n=1 Tax=Halomontanus rarus TaxID=3034020 RepID=UPI001A99D1D5
MTPDKHVAERLRFARVLGISSDGGSGLPVGSSLESAGPRRHRDGDSDFDPNADRTSDPIVPDTETDSSFET